ncbi:helix-turn-helix domain-containing protein [Deinococcus ruber]|uniref:helix-turn-helix domain-containing protein n=1 Tax=Deinococcus ruber TaxID=1848197 RepID=UPI00166EB020
MTEVLYGAVEAAKLMNIHRVTLSRLIRAGKIKAFTVSEGGKRVRYVIPASSIQEYMHI